MASTGQTMAGGLLLYEIGTADVGLASAGWGARAQDASTVFTNQAGMTRLEGSQILLGAQVLYGDYGFSIGPGTSADLGTDDGGNPIGWMPGGGAFMTFSASPDLKFGFAMAGNFGLSEKYDDDWVGRYYVQEATLLGMSFPPSIAYKVNDKLSVGGSLNVMYGVLKDKVAVNNVAPGAADGRLELDDIAWGLGFNIGLLYEVSAGTRFSLTYTSQVDLDFEAPAEFSNLAPGLEGLLRARGLLDASVNLGVKVPQQVMVSAFHQVSPRWAELGISETDFGGKLKIEGKDPIVASRHDIGESTSVLLGLFGMELAAIWKQRTGRSQDVKVNVRNAVMAAPGLNARLRPEFDLPLVTSTGPLGEMSVLPPQVEFSEFKLGPRFSGDPNGASKLDWSVFT